MNKLPILMTSSVSTRGMKNACFSSEEREQMYIETIRFYIDKLLSENPDCKLVFAENSGWDLHTIQYNTIQYNTIQYNTIQYNTIQYNTITTLNTK